MNSAELEIAWDPAKAKANLVKLGVSFSQALALVVESL